MHSAAAPSGGLTDATAARQRRNSADLVSPIAGLCYGRDGALFTELADGSVVEWDALAI